MALEKLLVFEAAEEAPEAELYIPDDWLPEVIPTSDEKLDILVDEEKVHEVLSTLLSAYKDNAFPYNLDGARLPHDPRHMPPSLPYGSRDHAMFLWNSCYYMRGGIKSVDAFKRLSDVYEDRPDFFNCEAAAQLEVADIATVLTTHGLGFQERVAKEIIENSRRLLERFDGDPRNIFSSASSYKECLDHIKNKGKGKGFVGFQEKMTSMIIYYLMDEDLIEPFMFPIPIDLHVMRVSIANEMITFPNAPHGTNLFTPDTLAILRKVYFDYAVEHDINPLRLCDAVWMLSASICGHNPGNKTLEPHGRKHREGRLTYLIPSPVNPDNQLQRKSYKASCGTCPIEQHCRHNIPGTPYYVSGSIIIRGKRLRLPQPFEQTVLFET